MKTSKVIVLVLLALVVGGVVGGLIARTKTVPKKAALNAIGQAATPQVSTYVKNLRMLREGRRDEAIESQETLLDMALVTVGQVYEEGGTNRDPIFGEMRLEALREARDYRTKYPRTDALPEIAEKVARVFSFVE